ncbi:PTS system, fructose-specific enzyme II, BC component [Lentisphaera araneosa HTCC2155]|uniref:PTS system, fructose-specific enzyme II, BC component n=1 Tax=Lentisphaera araneosa HTCC2155 TaxID=313628 RepID=A6DFY2_9BACT|nr:PTS sugar transporter subunit IIA [Lentisphaera araneosa]EDM29712.1 PTS system, fructose-specific enzyme II, BC component [Lentisphaera araneosa HTCC2155]
MFNHPDLVKITSQILIVGALIFLAYVGGRITRRIGLGEIIGQISGGFVGGPLLMSYSHKLAEQYPHVEEMLKWSFPLKQVHNYAIVSFVFFMPIYLGVILFSITDETHIDRIKENWRFSSFNFISQSALAFGLVSCALYFLTDLGWPISCIAGCLAVGTSPCSAFISMSRRQVEGKFKTVWSQTVVLEAIAEVFIVFLVVNYFVDEAAAWDLRFIGKSFIIIAIISVVGFWLIRTAASNSFSSDEIKGVVNDSKLKNLLSSDTIPTVNIVFVIWSVIALVVGVSLGLKVPFMLPVIFAGVITANVHNQYIFDSLRIQDLMGFFHLIFFALLGVHLDLSTLMQKETFVIASVYFVMRLIGKLGGGYLSCSLFAARPEAKKYLPLLFIPNMGATGIAFIVLHQHSHPLLNTFINGLVPAFILSEILGAPFINWSVKKWKQILIADKQSHSQLDSSNKSSDVEKIPLESLFHDRVLLNVELRTKEDAIKMLCSELMKNGDITDLQATISLVLEREKLSTTGIGDEIAIPHCRSADVEYPMAVFAYIREGESIDWDSVDGAGVRYIILLVSPLNEPQMHIEAMKNITKSLMKPGFIDGLQVAAKRKTTLEWLKNQ